MCQIVINVPANYFNILSNDHGGLRSMCIPLLPIIKLLLLHALKNHIQQSQLTTRVLKLGIIKSTLNIIAGSWACMDVMFTMKHIKKFGIH